MMITEKQFDEYERVYAIVINKLLPKREDLNKRYFVDEKWLSMGRIIKLLTEAGYKVTDKKMPKLCLANEYKGIKIKSKLGGLMILPKDPKEYEILLKLLQEDGYFFHPCYLPKQEE